MSVTLRDDFSALVELAARPGDTAGIGSNYLAKALWVEKSPGMIEVTYETPVSHERRTLEIRIFGNTAVIEGILGPDGQSLMNTTMENQTISLVRKDQGTIKLPNAV